MEPEAAPDFPTAAWSHVRDLAHLLISTFGLPHQIAAMVLLTRKTRAHILQWLVGAEALARRMLLIQAAALPKPNAPPPGKAKRINVKAAHGRAGFAADDSEKWAVSFKVLPSRRTAKRKRAARKPFGTKHPDARALAERIEALIRVAVAPEPYIQRLARRLHAQPHKAQRIAKPIPPHKPGRTNPAYTLLCEAQPLALQACARFSDSS